MRYIYALRKEEERKEKKLKRYEDKIKDVLRHMHFLKESNLVVRERSFEFSFAGCIPRKDLQKMGRFLVKSGVGKNGFVRQNNKAYAFVSYDASRDAEEQVLIEFADCSTLDFEHESEENELPQWVHFYRGVELCTSYVSVEKARNIFNGSLEDSVYLVELHHHHMQTERYREVLLSNDLDGENSMKKYTCVIEHLYSAGLYQPEIVNLADVKNVKKLSESEIERIKAKFDFDLEGDLKSSFKPKKSEENKNSLYTFTVHDVGQALATSLSEKGKKPFFYFDFGIAYGKNKDTVPKNVNLPIGENATILLSHVDEDHWCGFRANNNALKCRWIVPQKPTKALTKTLSDVYLHGGSIRLYRAQGDTIFEIVRANSYMFAGNALSKIKNGRLSKAVHENGNALYIFAQYKGKEYKIVVSGDQDYDYQNPCFLDDVNLLVACHHGGKYSWSKKAEIPKPHSEENIIVYSYGENNSYGHPSKCGEYKKRGWNIEHRTPVGHDFVLDLKLENNIASLLGLKIKMLNSMVIHV